MILMDNILREEVKSLREKSIEVETPVKEEDIKILKEMNYDEEKAFKPYKRALEKRQRIAM